MLLAVQLFLVTPARASASSVTRHFGAAIVNTFRCLEAND